MAGKVNSRKSKAKLDDAITLNGEAKEASETGTSKDEVHSVVKENAKVENTDVSEEASSSEETSSSTINKGRISTEETSNSTVHKGVKRKASELSEGNTDTDIQNSPQENNKENTIEVESLNDSSADIQTRKSGRKVRPKKPKTAYDDSPVHTMESEIKQEIKDEPMDDETTPTTPDTSYLPNQVDSAERPSSQMSVKSEDGVSVESPILGKSKVKLDLSNPLFREPMALGWKRELVFRATVDNKNRRQGDIYYYTPTGKKLRSTREIADYLTDGLTLENFTFAKEPIGLNDPSKEIIRDARNIKGRSSVGGVDSPVTPTTTPTSASGVLGKRTPKPKLPKGASPPPASPVVVPPVAETPPKPSPKKSPKSSFKVKLTGSRLTGSPKTSGIKPAKVQEKKAVFTEKSQKTIVENKPPEKKKRMVLGTTGKKASFKKKIAKENSPTKTAKEVPHETAPALDDKQNAITNSPKASNAVSQKSATKLNTTAKSSKDQVKTENNVESKVVTASASASASAHAPFVQHFCLNVSAGYFALLKIFQYLKVQELLRASRVCRLWNEMSNSPSLWRTVRMKNSQVGDWNGFAKSLQKHQTKNLDLRKMLIPASVDPDDMWKQFSENIGLADSLISIDFCRCPGSIIEKLCESNPNLEVINALTIRDDKLNLLPFSTLKNLRELRLKSSGGFEIQKDLSSLRELKNLRHLSITSVKDLGKFGCEVIAELTELQSLELGECNEFSESFASNVLDKLQKLERLRLEKGQGNCHTFNILECVSKLPLITQLELVNFDIKTGFDKSLALCTNIRRMLIIPTYITQSATTNHMVLSGVIKLSSSLTHFVWGVTLELLRVTELFVDQYENSKLKDKKPLTESIPVLKPVPSLAKQEENVDASPGNTSEAPQVEILTLQALQKLLNGSLPQTRVRILKIPFHATWRQSISETQ